MKKIVTIVCAIALGFTACIAGESGSLAANNASVESSKASVRVPKGVFFNGRNFIKVESTWLRIVINGEMQELNFNAQKDPSGNYLLRLENGECITIYSNGRSLYYNGDTYSKKRLY